MTFSDFDFSPQVIESIQAMGFDKPTPIQEQAIPVHKPVPAKQLPIFYR